MNKSLAVRGARENNLRDLDLDLPLGQLVVFTGVSGSGKSSLAFDTIHAEAQRRYLEASSAWRAKPARLTAPRVEAVEGLPPTIALDQRGAMPARGRTIADVSGAMAPLRLLFARAGVQHCPTCDRAIVPVSHDEIVARVLSLTPGARVTIEAPVRRRGAVTLSALLDEVAHAGFSRVRLGGSLMRLDAIRAVDREGDGALRVVVDRVRVDPTRADRLHDAVRTAGLAGTGEVVIVREGDEPALHFVDRPYCVHDDRTFPPLAPRSLDARTGGRCAVCGGTAYVSDVLCASCSGLGLSDVALAVRFAGEGLAEVLGRTVSEAHLASRAWPQGAVTERAIADWRDRLGRLIGLGLGDLPLAREAATASSGERQRLRLARQVGGQLSGVLYVLDEPAAGLGAAATRAVVQAMRTLIAAGNSVLAVAHHPLVIAAADHVIDFGPGAGAQGGQVVFRGSPADLLTAETCTARWLSGRETLSPPEVTAAPPAWVEVMHGLAPVRLPVGALCAISGPSGVGKTRLLARAGAARRAAMDRREAGSFRRVIDVDRRGVRRSSRSNVATFTGVWQVLRDLLSQTVEARVRGLPASMFSLNVKGGRCERCRGAGVERVDLQWLPDVFLPCVVCGGRRFTADVLSVRWKGLAPDALLALSASQARAHLSGHPDLEARLRAIEDVGLGYMPLGQAGHTWSGGEAQRLLLARELARANRSGAEGVLLVLDDPTVGLHPADVKVLLALLRRLVQDGATAWLATHDTTLAEACDVVVALEATGARSRPLGV